MTRIQAEFAGVMALLTNGGKDPWWEWPAVILLALALLAAVGLLANLIPCPWVAVLSGCDCSGCHCSM